MKANGLKKDSGKEKEFRCGKMEASMKACG